VSGLSLEEQRAYYDERWQNTHYGNLLEMERASKILSLLRATGLTEPRILDLGCGRGWLAGILSAFGPVTGVDLSPEGIARARDLWPQVDFRAGDVFTMPLETDAYDVVVSQEVLEHVDDQSGYLAVAARCLRPGGVLILTTPNRRALDRFTEWEKEAWGVQPLEHWVTRSELISLLAERFDVSRSGTFIAAGGSRGILFFCNTRPLRGPTAGLRCRLGLGLHLFALARRR